MEIRPITGSKPAADVAADLRELAELVEGDPFVGAVVERIFTTNLVFPAHAVGAEHEGQEPAVLAEAIRAFKSITVHGVQKDYRGEFIHVTVPLRALPIRMIDLRSRVCERVVTGVETVTEEVVDPDYVAPTPPTVTVTREVETVEWKCAPLLAEPSSAEVSV
ncbi:hypothetical protein [Nocardia salmonicida]|uniref:hypothetical protein n=1 Tax=Nocardia salmonicida TaxID=53431 RepID=UPI00378CD1B6